MGLPPPDGGYSSAHEWAARLDAAADSAAARGVTVETIGYSVRKQPIVAYHVPAALDERHHLLVVGQIHALEWITLETAGQLVLDLIVAPEPHTAVTVVPVLNPDGRGASEQGVVTNAGRYYRRNAANTDLNRDWAVNHRPGGVWAEVLPGYASSSPRAMSQPETRALDRLIARERFDRGVSLHAFGGYLYWPWAGRWGRPDDWVELATLGRVMEAAQGPHAYRSKQLSRWGFFFRAHGAEIDHWYGRYDMDAYLIELTRSGIRPLHLRRTTGDTFYWYNPDDPAPHVARGLAAVRALAAADDP